MEKRENKARAEHREVTELQDQREKTARMAKLDLKDPRAKLVIEALLLNPTFLAQLARREPLVKTELRDSLARTAFKDRLDLKVPKDRLAKTEKKVKMESKDQRERMALRDQREKMARMESQASLAPNLVLLDLSDLRDQLAPPVLRVKMDRTDQQALQEKTEKTALLVLQVRLAELAFCANHI